MKFQEEHVATRQTLPPDLFENVLNYKKYKQITKSKNEVIFFNELKNDIRYINTFWQTFYKSKIKKPTCSLFRCLHTDTQPNSIQAYTYIDLNHKTLYKICKRASKRYQNKNPYVFLDSLKNSKNAGVFGGMVKKEVQLLVDNHTSQEDCPVCFETLKDNRFVLLHCGHLMCLGCVMKYLNVHELYGEVRNLIAYGMWNSKKNICCPLCRDRYAFIKYKTYH